MAQDYYRHFIKRLIDKEDRAKLKSHTLVKLYEAPKKQKKNEASHYKYSEANATHQADLLFLPEDNHYKYLLVVTDVKTKKIDAIPLKKKSDVLAGFKAIYKHGILNMPLMIAVDSGSEFKSKEVIDFFNNAKIILKRSKVDRHKQTTFVEQANNKFVNFIFKRATAEQLLTGETEIKWVKDIQEQVAIFNLKKMRHVIENEPEEFIPVIQPSKGYGLLTEGTKVRVALSSPKSLTGEKLHGRFRQSDIRWSPEVRTIKYVNLFQGRPVTYLLDGHDNARGTENVQYVRKELQVIDKNEVEPPSSVIRGKKYVVHKILDKQKYKGVVKYLIQWRGFPSPTYYTWEKRKELITNPKVKEMIDEFDKKRKRT